MGGTGLGGAGLGSAGLGGPVLGGTGRGCTGRGCSGLEIGGLGGTGRGSAGLGSVGLGSLGLGGPILGGTVRGCTGRGSDSLETGGLGYDGMGSSDMADLGVDGMANQSFLDAVGFNANSFDGDSDDPFFDASADMWYDDGSHNNELRVRGRGHGRGMTKPRHAASGGLSRGMAAVVSEGRGSMPPPSSGGGRGKRPRPFDGGHDTRGHGKAKAAYKPPRPDVSESDGHVDSQATGEDEELQEISTRQLKYDPPEHEELLAKIFGGVVVDGSTSCAPGEVVGQGHDEGFVGRGGDEGLLGADENVKTFPSPSLNDGVIEKLLDMTVDCGVSEESAEYFMATLLFKNAENRSTFKAIKTKNKRVAWLRRHCDKEGLAWK
ncbi:hypothetical protein PR202_gb10467 [Eleusine coracana subsp. coracana]|uniref:Uncharacterized protein n=1 Tax=Eleusine coracana subsp. coracana TaxID=191504 RepID=A0AAV5EJM0_ELECO|nr:hypothetical protein PR202_gb10467 [Eleusine coracana subsp. coracana]